MITQANDVKRFFERLGMILKVHKPTNKPSQFARHTLECMPSGKIGPERMEALLSYYFKDVRYAGFDTCTVLLSEFNPEGHGEVDVCKLCGCTNGDACPDHETGTCWWVHEDLCSACATKEQKEAAKAEMRLLFKEENR
jgi:hypothetical protein